MDVAKLAPISGDAKLLAGLAARSAAVAGISIGLLNTPDLRHFPDWNIGDQLRQIVSTGRLHQGASQRAALAVRRFLLTQPVSATSVGGTDSSAVMRVLPVHGGRCR
jgi:hypothetical protein